MPSQKEEAISDEKPKRGRKKLPPGKKRIGRKVFLYQDLIDWLILRGDGNISSGIEDLRAEFSFLSIVAGAAERVLDNATALQEQFNPESFEVSAYALSKLRHALYDLDSYVDRNSPKE